MKKIVIYIFLSIFIVSLCSCAKIHVEERNTENKDSGLTSPNGDVIPSYENVDYTFLDPALFKTDEKERYYYDDPEINTYTGIDVSTFQGSINWDEVKSDGIDFVMLRVGYRGYGSEGKLGDDDLFMDNYNGAHNAGLKVGVYFFSQAINADEARQEADFVLDRIKGLDIEYPVAYDWEHIDYDNARTDNLQNSQISECAAAFCEKVTNAGYNALIYFNRELGYFNYDLSMVSDYHFWLAEYLSAPSFVYDYKIWQYSKTGSVKGINGNVDLNISVVNYSYPLGAD